MFRCAYGVGPSLLLAQLSPLWATSQVTFCDVKSLVGPSDAASLSGCGWFGQDRGPTLGGAWTATLAVLKQSRSLEPWFPSVSGLWPAGLTHLCPPFVPAAPSPSLSHRKKLAVPPSLDVSADWLQPELKKQEVQARNRKEEKTPTWGTRGQSQ